MTNRPDETWQQYCSRVDGFGDARLPEQPGSVGFAPYEPPTRDASGSIVRRKK